MALLWQRLVKADWPGYQKGSLSTVSDSTAWSQPSGSPSSNWIKTNYVSGDTYGTPPTYRCEGANVGSNNTTAKFHEGDEAWFRYWFVWEQIPTYSSNWNIFFQGHLSADGTQPVVTVSTNAGRKLQFRHSAGGGHTIDWQSTQDVTLNAVHKILIGVKFASNSANGWIEWWYDDVNVVPRKAAACFASGDGGIYMKQGIYRSGQITGNAVFYNNGFQVFDSEPGATGSAPSNVTVPTVSGSAVEGQTLTATAGTWSGSPTPTFTYQWQKSSDNGAVWADVTGETATTFLLPTSLVSWSVRVKVTATNSAGSAIASSALAGPVTAISTPFDGPPSAIADFTVAAGDGGFPASEISSFNSVHLAPVGWHENNAALSVDSSHPFADSEPSGTAVIFEDTFASAMRVVTSHVTSAEGADRSGLPLAATDLIAVDGSTNYLYEVWLYGNGVGGTRILWDSHNSALTYLGSKGGTVEVIPPAAWTKYAYTIRTPATAAYLNPRIITSHSQAFTFWVGKVRVTRVESSSSDIPRRKRVRTDT